MKRILVDKKLDFNFLADFFQLNFGENSANSINQLFFAEAINRSAFAQLKSQSFMSFTNDSRHLQKGDIFFALKGVNSNPKDFIREAVELSASLILVEEATIEQSTHNKIAIIDQTLVIYIKNLTEKTGAFLAEVLQINSSCKNEIFDIYAVTGTNGKTSIAHFLTQSWQNLGFKVAIIGTIGNGELNNLSATVNTTPDIFTLYNLLFLWKKSGVQKVVMEASSHALVQKRLAGLKIKTIIFSNLSQDHLDYHKNMQDYAAAKKLLFSDYCAKNACINLDDNFGSLLLNEFNKKIKILGFSKKDKSAQIFLTEQKILNSALAATFVYKNNSYTFRSQLIGSFNFDNLMALIACLLFENISIKKILTLVELLNPVIGRMELISGNQVLASAKKEQNISKISEDFWQNSIYEYLPKTLIDYAHTPDALAKALESVSSHSQAKLICVFGAGGDRDKSKRPLMAEVASKIADKIYITDDNPRSENPAEIRAQILAGINKKSGLEVIEIGDRKSAIFQAIEDANSADWILIAGKGQEDYQIIGSEKTYFSDVKVASSALAKKATKLLEDAKFTQKSSLLSAIPVTKIAQVLNGKLLVGKNFTGDLHRTFIKKISLDSRTTKNAHLFVALKGKNFDGHSFVQDLPQGSFALVELKQDFAGVQILVKNTQAALVELATFVRTGFAGTLIGVTGNSGKTSVKDLLSAILAENFCVSATLGNLNNDLGMPMSLLNFAANTQVGILEMGANHLGEIAALAKIAQPNIAIITNVTGAHLGEFGSFANIAEAKSELLDQLTEKNLAILPYDDKYFKYWLNKNSQVKQISFSLKNPNADLCAKEIKSSLSASHFYVELNSKVLNRSEKSPLLKIAAVGEHQVINALAAIGVALYLGLSWEQIKKGLSKFKTSAGRMKVLSGFNNSLLIDDSYNANQGSVEAGIKFLCSQKDKTKILVLGDIKELGDYGEQIHRNLGAFAKKSGVDFLYTFGDLAALAAQEFGTSATAFYDKQKLALALKALLDEKSLLLIKGSRSMKLEEILLTLKS